MSAEDNKTVILRWFEAVNQGDLHLIDRLAEELFTPDFIEHDPRMPNFEPGPLGVKKFIHEVFSENSNVQVTVHDIFASGDKVAYRFSVSMTDKENKKPVNVQLLALTHFNGRQCAEEWQLSAVGKW